MYTEAYNTHEDGRMKSLITMYLRSVVEQTSTSIHLINDVSDLHEQRVTVDRNTRHTSDVLGNKCLRVRKIKIISAAK